MTVGGESFKVQLSTAWQFVLHHCVLLTLFYYDGNGSVIVCSMYSHEDWLLLWSSFYVGFVKYIKGEFGGYKLTKIWICLSEHLKT